MLKQVQHDARTSFVSSVWRTFGMLK